jgi:hypothetical protein
MASRRQKNTFLYKIAAENKASQAVRGVRNELAGLRRATFETFGSFSFGIDIAKSLASAISSIGRASAVPIKAAIEQERVQAQLNAALKSTQFAAGLTADELTEMARGFQASTTFGDELTMQAQALLLTFTNIGGKGGIFERTTAVTLDVATAMRMDLSSAAVQVGKALNDPATGLSMLTRVGITFTEEQKELIKALQASGDVAAAQVVILEELERQFGGSAKALRETFGGALQSTQNAWGDLLEAFGEMVTQSPEVQAALDSVTRVLGDMADSLRDGEGGFAGLRETVEDFISSAVPALLRGLALVIDAMQGKGGLAGVARSIAISFGEIALTIQRVGVAVSGVTKSFTALNAYLDDDYNKVLSTALAYAEQKKALTESKKALEEQRAALRIATQQTTEYGDVLRNMALELEEARAQALATGDGWETFGAKLQGAHEQLEAARESFDATADAAAGMNEVLAETPGAGGTAGLGEAAPADPESSELGRAVFDPIEQAGNRAASGLSAAIASAAGGFATLEEAGMRWTQGLRAEATNAFLEPMLGAESAMSELFEAAFSPLRMVGELVEENFIRPLIDGILRFFGVKTAAEGAAAAEAEGIHAASATAQVITQKTAVAAMMPGLGAAASAALVATFGGAGAFAALLPGILATGAATGAAAAAFYDGGRVARPTWAKLGEAGEEWVIPVTRTGRAQEVLLEMLSRNPTIAGSPSSAGRGARGGSAGINVNVFQAGQSPQQTAFEVARSIDRQLGDLGG